MSYRGLVQRMVNEHALLSVYLELTYRCNLDCFYCYNDLSLKGERLATADYLRLLDDLHGMQVLQLVLSGGEPLASPAFWPVGRRARELGFMVRIKSNGHAMRNEVARRVQTEIDPYLVEVSLHGARAETHDRQTRVEGSFERLVANLCEMQTVGLRLKLNATLTSWNEDEVEGMFSLADAMGIPLSFDPVVTPRDDGGREPLSIAASLDGVRRLYRLVEARGAKELDPNQDASTLGAGSKKNCGTGSATVAIDPFGNVYPCVQWRRSVGNLHRQSFKDIWGKSKSLEQVRALNARAGRLVDELGPRARDAGFCLGLAEELTGDPLTLYPEVERNLQVLEELETEKTAILLPVYGQR